MEGRRILAIRAGALGDTILVLPALAALRRAVGDSGSLSFVGREPFVGLAEGPLHASSVHSVDRALFRALYDPRADDRELLSFLESFDLVIAWSSFPLLREKLRDGVQAIEAPPLPPAGVHAAEHLVRTLAPLGIEGPSSVPTIVPGVASHRMALGYLAGEALFPGQFVAIHPSSGSLRKNWPADRFVHLARRVLGQGFRLAWVEGEADGPVLRDLVEAVPAPVARGLSLPTLGAVLSCAFGYIGNDSGVTHLAAAVQAPTIALFGPTDPRVWAPTGATVADFSDSADDVWAKALRLFQDR